MQEEYEYEMERLERMRCMQSAFNSERSKFKKNNESLRDQSAAAYQHFQLPPTDRRNSALSYHYSVLGLDRSRTEPYSDAEIKEKKEKKEKKSTKNIKTNPMDTKEKSVFRSKAMVYHPDHNQSNKEVAEAKFKELMISYEAIISERKIGSP